VSEPSTPEKATADTKAPSKPEINTDLTDKAGTKTPVEVSAEPGSKVELFDKDGHKLGEGVADENGKTMVRQVDGLIEWVIRRTVIMLQFVSSMVQLVNGMVIMVWVRMRISLIDLKTQKPCTISGQV